MKKLILTTACSVFLSLPAWAGPGRIEISAGDIPLIITNSGSYVVTENLDAGLGDGITIKTDDIVIDFNGYALIGGVGSDDGIDVDGSHVNLVVRNGIIRNWNGAGVRAPSLDQGVFEDLQLNNNGTHGLILGSRCRVARCTARENGATGMYLTRGSRIEDCVVSGNGNVTSGGGISVSNHCAVVDCVVSENGKYEIAVGQSCAVTDNLVDGNGDNNGFKSTPTGILVQGGYNRIQNNHVTGCVDGIYVANGSRSLVVGNSAANNSGTNFRFSSSGNERGETVTTNVAGAVNSYMNVSQ